MNDVTLTKQVHGIENFDTFIVNLSNIKSISFWEDRDIMEVEYSDHKEFINFKSKEYRMAAEQLINYAQNQHISNRPHFYYRKSIKKKSKSRNYYGADYE